MKKIQLFVVFIFCLASSACLPVLITATPMVEPTQAPTEQQLTQTSTTASEPELSIITLKNSVYYSPSFQKQIQLSQGRYSYTDENGMYYSELFEPIVFGYLNDDQIEDAAVLLAENSGGTGIFVYLLALVSQEDGYTQIGNIYIDDRPIIHSMEILNGEIFIDATIHGFTDAMVEPTLGVEKHYRLLENMLTLISLNSTPAGGQERSITIDEPVDGDEVASTLVIKGNMPIAPFENNLRLAVYDLAGTTLYETGFMVTSSDVGGPATFENQVSLPDLASDSWVRIELAELSMADGSLMASKSVVVKIK